ncbi:purine-nucleoside phosphorylase [Phytoactinopolyspora limicola]|uniref:purine-nucleoside phosphorylase n=1 Tax=Phytoactinopolyspora limicola TaxID=2715536 RepID=UPI001A9C43E4|nr:purine-nucleoside phosphorylase [Phytoactinopolyspora limicola]
MTMTDRMARDAASMIGNDSGVAAHDVAIVMGSGWSRAAEALGHMRCEFRPTELPGFVAPAVAGHAGRIRSISFGDTDVLAFLGRTHLYENHGVGAVVHSVRVAAAAGCRAIVLTNGCGSLNPDWPPGTPVLIRDHINLTGTSPLVGADFVDLTDLYSAELRELCRNELGGVPEGVYAQLPGPHYETPAEITMLRRMGADLVGMSTALEAIAARAAGMSVVGISLVTNAAAGMGTGALDHQEVIDAGQSAAGRLGEFLTSIVPCVATSGRS